MITPLFVLSSLAVIVTPGPDLALITQFTLHHPRTVVIAAAVGMTSAGAVHVLVGIAGLTAALQSVPELSTAWRWIGAAVLLWRASASLRSALSSDGPGGRALLGGSPSKVKAFLTGAACTGSNPKVALFLIAFLPQFVPVDSPLWQGMALLGAVYLAIALAWLLVWALLVEVLSRNLLTPSRSRVAELCTATVLTGLAVRLGLT